MSLRRPQDNLKISCPSCEQKLDASGIPAFERINCPNCSFNFAVPYRFGQYLLEGAVSETPFAGVYRGKDIKLKRLVAVKILVEDLASDIDAIQIFLDAARRTAILNHANILPIYSSDCHDGLPYIVMEYMAGHCLDQHLRSAPSGLPIADCITHCDLATRGLEIANRDGVAHGGICPSNLLWDGDGNIKISDFGMHHFKRKCAEMTGLDWRSYLHVGYCSPELLGGDGNAGAPSDIFGLGATLYHLLTGQRPFPGSLDTRLSSLGSPPPPPRQLRPEIPPALSDYTMRMIATEPSQRPRGYRDVISTLFSLKEAMNHPSLPAATSSVKRKGKLRIAVAHTPRPGRIHRRKHPLWTSAINVLVLLVFVALVAFAAAAIFRSRGEISRLLGISASEPAKEISERGAQSIPTLNRPREFARRPIPFGLDFSAQNASIMGYVGKLPGGLVSDETARLRVLSQTRPHLRQLLSSLTYQGKEGIRLRSGETLSGSVAGCTDSGISVKTAGGQVIAVGWDDLSMRQFQVFFEFYIGQRQVQTTPTPGEKVALARDYLMLALLCDWLGETDRATVHARSAIQADLQSEKRVRQLLPYLAI